MWDPGSNTTTLLQAINRSIGSGPGSLRSITYNQGANWTTYSNPANDIWIAEAVAAATAADVVVAVVGDSDSAYGHGTESHAVLCIISREFCSFTGKGIQYGELSLALQIAQSAAPSHASVVGCFASVCCLHFVDMGGSVH